MRLPDKLTHAYPSLPRKESETEPMFRTHHALLTFEDGTRSRVELTAPNRPYWAGQLEKTVMSQFNQEAARRGGLRVTKVRIFRNTEAGGDMAAGDSVLKVY